MKLSRIILICAALLTVSACDNNPSEDLLPKPEQTEQLEFSIASNQTIIFEDTEFVMVTTDGYDYNFDIESGNGEYEVVDAYECKVTVTGTQVLVNMLYQTSHFTIKDKEGLQKSVWIESSNSIIKNKPGKLGMSTVLGEGEYYDLEIGNFGIGDYSVENIRGNSAQAEIISGDKVRFNILRRGTSHFVVYDERGMGRDFEINVFELIDMRAAQFDIDVKSEDCINIQLSKDKEWEITSVSLNSIIDIIAMHRGKTYVDFDHLQVNINSEVTAGDICRIALTANDGSTTQIKLRVN